MKSPVADATRLTGELNLKNVSLIVACGGIAASHGKSHPFLLRAEIRPAEVVLIDDELARIVGLMLPNEIVDRFVIRLDEFHQRPMYGKAALQRKVLVTRQTQQSVVGLFQLDLMHEARRKRELPASDQLRRRRASTGSSESATRPRSAAWKVIATLLSSGLSCSVAHPLDTLACPSTQCDERIRHRRRVANSFATSAGQMREIR